MRVACVATLLSAASVAEAATIVLTPSAMAVDVGETFTIDIAANDVNLGAFELTIGFEPARVSLLEEPEYFDFLGAPASLQIPAIGIDYVEVDETSFMSVPELLALQGAASGNSFLLGRLQFKAESAGVADFTFLFDYLTDVTGQNRIVADLTPTSVTIGTPQGDAVPEPSTMTLAGVALAMAFTLRRFRSPGL
jgi:hypothetical protein